MIKYFKIAIRNLLKHKSRSLILGLSIVFLTVLLIVLTSLTAGVKYTMQKTSTTIFSGHVNIAGYYKTDLDSSSPVLTEYKEILKLAKENLREAKYFTDRLRGFGTLVSDQDSTVAVFWGIDITEEKDFTETLGLAKKTDYIEDYELKEGESLYEGNIQDLNQRNAVVIPAEYAEKLKVRVNDIITVSVMTPENVSNTKDMKVVAVLQDIGLFSAFATFIHKEDLRELYIMAEDATGQIQIYLNDMDDVPVVEDRLRKIVDEAGYNLREKDRSAFFEKMEITANEDWTGQQVDITTWEDELSFAEFTLQIFNSVSFIFILVLMIIIIVGLMNTLWMSIRERTKEVGTLRAIGMTRGSVMGMFMSETFLLSVVSTTIGIVVGIWVAFFLNSLDIEITNRGLQFFLMSDKIIFLVNNTNVVSAFLNITVLTTLGAIYPAYKASKMRPITAIQHIG